MAQTQSHPFNPDSSAFILLKPSWRFTSPHIYTSNRKRREDVLLLFLGRLAEIRERLIEEEIRRSWCLVLWSWDTLRLKRDGYFTGKEIKTVRNLRRVAANTHTHGKRWKGAVLHVTMVILPNTEKKRTMYKRNVGFFSFFSYAYMLWSCSPLCSRSALNHITHCRLFSLKALSKNKAKKKTKPTFL